MTDCKCCGNMKAVKQVTIKPKKPSKKTLVVKPSIVVPVKPVKLARPKPSSAPAPASAEIVYYGERGCEAKYGHGGDCRNNAYFEYDGRYLCGVHSKKYEGKRTQLPKNPNKGQMKKDEQELRDKLVEQATLVNRDRKSVV